MLKPVLVLAIETRDGLFSHGFVPNQTPQTVLEIADSFRIVAATTGAMVRALEPFWNPDSSMRAAFEALEGAPLPKKMHEAALLIVWKDYHTKPPSSLLADGLILNQDRAEAPLPNWLQPEERLVFAAHATRHLAWLLANQLCASSKPEVREKLFAFNLNTARQTILQRFASAQRLLFAFDWIMEPVE